MHRVKSLIGSASQKPTPPPAPEINESEQDLIHPFCQLYYQCQSLSSFERQFLYLKYCFYADPQKKDEEKKAETVKPAQDTELLPLLGKLIELNEADLEKYLEKPRKQYTALARDLALLLTGEGYKMIADQTNEINEKLTQLQKELEVIQKFYQQHKSGVKYHQLFEENKELAALLLLVDELNKSHYTTATLSQDLSSKNLELLEKFLKDEIEVFDSLIKLFSNVNVQTQPLITKIRLDSAELMISLIKKASISITVHKSLSSNKSTTAQTAEAFSSLSLAPQPQPKPHISTAPTDSKAKESPKIVPKKTPSYLKSTSSSASKKPLSQSKSSPKAF